MKSIQTFLGRNVRVVMGFFIGMAIMIGASQVLAQPAALPPSGSPTANFTDVNVLGTLMGVNVGTSTSPVANLYVTNINGVAYSPASSSGVTNPMQGNFEVTGVYPPSATVWTNPQSPLTGNITGRMLHSTNNTYVGMDLFVEEDIRIDNGSLSLLNGVIGAAGNISTGTGNVIALDGDIRSYNGRIWAAPLNSFGNPALTYTATSIGPGDIAAANTLYARDIRGYGDIILNGTGLLDINTNADIQNQLTVRDRVLIEPFNPSVYFGSYTDPEWGAGDLGVSDDIFVDDKLFVGDNAEIGGDLTVTGDIIGLSVSAASLPNPLVIGALSGPLLSTYTPLAGDVVAERNVMAGAAIEAAARIEAGTTLTAGTSVSAGSSIEAGTMLIAGTSVSAGSNIVSMNGVISTGLVNSSNYGSWATSIGAGDIAASSDLWARGGIQVLNDVRSSNGVIYAANGKIYTGVPNLHNFSNITAVSGNGDIISTNDVFVDDNLYVDNNAIVGGTLQTMGNANFQGNLYNSGAQAPVTINDNLQVGLSPATMIPGTLTGQIYNGDVNSLSFNAHPSFGNYDIATTDDLFVDDDLFVGDQITASGNITTDGQIGSFYSRSGFISMDRTAATVESVSLGCLTGDVVISCSGRTESSGADYMGAKSVSSAFYCGGDQGNASGPGIVCMEPFTPGCTAYGRRGTAASGTDLNVYTFCFSPNG